MTFNFLHIPPEVQRIIVDRMLPDDRCRFSGCSKICNMEAKSSTNYIHTLDLLVIPHYATIFVSHIPRDKPRVLRNDYSFSFINTSGCKKMICCNKYAKLWDIDMEEPVDLNQHAIHYFENLLEKYQRSIRIMSIGEGVNLDLEMRRFDNLEDLRISGNIDILQLLSKTRRPLKVLEVKGSKTNRGCEQVCHVQNDLHWPELKLNNEQFRKLSASRVCINLGDLTEEDIFDFIQSWQNGKIGREIENWCWNIKGLGFSIQKLLRLLGAAGHNFSHGPLQLRHHYEEAKTRYLVHNSSQLIFRLANNVFRWINRGSEGENEVEYVVIE